MAQLKFRGVQIAYGKVIPTPKHLEGSSLIWPLLVALIFIQALQDATKMIQLLTINI